MRERFGTMFIQVVTGDGVYNLIVSLLGPSATEAYFCPVPTQGQPCIGTSSEWGTLLARHKLEAKLANHTQVANILVLRTAHRMTIQEFKRVQRAGIEEGGMTALRAVWFASHNFLTLGRGGDSVLLFMRNGIAQILGIPDEEAKLCSGIGDVMGSVHVPESGEANCP